MSGIFNLQREKVVGKVVNIEISRIIPNSNQPRCLFNDADLLSLADSVRENGILQPLSVRKVNDNYELIAGERRLRAAKLCELAFVPCIIYDITDKESAILALVENIQRQDLTFFEEANAIEKLINIYGLTQEEAAQQLGKAQCTIANKLRLLRLTEKERDLILKYDLTERHARALLKLGSEEDRFIILDKIITNTLNVEKTEKLIEDYIGCQKEKSSYKKRSKVFQNVKMFVNTINRAVETMQAAGISADSRKIQSENYIEYRVRIPIQRKS
ncbi:MAG: ParB/RepB/Spo0J family partition protein [Ruminococcus sp.]|nr:ParB/RepB/Spo0J family partition protein [Ruminococcus sp.]